MSQGSTCTMSILLKEDDKMERTINYNIFASYGVLAHEYQPVYTVGHSANEHYEQLTIRLPHVVGVDDQDEPLVRLDGETYRLRDVLTNRGDAPALSCYDGVRTRWELLDIVKSSKEATNT